MIIIIAELCFKISSPLLCGIEGVPYFIQYTVLQYYNMYRVPEGGGKLFMLQFLSANNTPIVSKKTMHKLVFDLSLTSSQYRDTIPGIG